MTRRTRTLVLDTSCIVALVSGWHERHAAVRRSVERHLASGAELALAAHSLVESFAVLTQLPAPHRLAAESARDVLDRNFRSSAKLQSLRASEHWQVIAEAAEQGRGGVQAYDALVARAAAKRTPCVLLTLSAERFGEHDVPGLTIEEP